MIYRQIALFLYKKCIFNTFVTRLSENLVNFAAVNINKGKLLPSVT